MEVVKVTRRGQTTIPKRFREALGIREGDELLVELRGGALVFRPIPKLVDLIGVDADYGDPEEVKREIEKLREEY